MRFGGLLAAYRHEGNTLTGVDRPERLESVLVSPHLFETLGVEARLGRTFRPSEETPGNEKLVVLSHAFWARRFGADPGLVDLERRVEEADGTERAALRNELTRLFDGVTLANICERTVELRRRRDWHW